MGRAISRVVGLDFGRTMGLAIVHSGVLVRHQSIKLPESHGERFHEFLQVLRQQCLQEGEFVAYESVARHIGTKAAHAYGGYLAIFQMFCYQAGVKSYGVPVGTLKKFATGSGRASKNEMIKAANDRLGLQLKSKDHNAADAIWVAQWAWENKVK
jgi:Holliday junction resolvasome RuvABC endonuclease subunit